MISAQRHSKKVLIVDDDPSLRDTLSSFLFLQGFSVESAENGCAALEILSGSTFDLLIVDAYMPKMNGFELLKCLQEKKIAIPSIFISGFINEEMREEVRRLKVLEIVEKPFSINEILRNIQRGLKAIEKSNQK